MEKLMSVAEAAQVLGLAPWTIYSWVREGRLPAVRLGRTIRISPAKLQKFVTASETIG